MGPGLLAALLTSAAGLSGFWSGAYDIETWGPAAMLVLAGLLALVFAYPARPRGLAVVALGAFTLFAVWTIASGLWASSVDRALLDGYRAVFYAGAFAAFVLCAGRAQPRLLPLPLAAAGVAIVILAGYVLIRMLGQDGAELFVAARLNGPLDYYNTEASLFLVGFWILIGFGHGARRWFLGAACAGGASMLLSLVVLTQSRGALVALGVSALALVAVAGTRVRLVWMLLVAIGGAAVALPEVLDVANGPNVPEASALRQAGAATLGGGALGALLWGAGTAMVSRLSSGRASRFVRVVSHAALGLVATAVMAGAVVAGTRADEFVEDFKSLEPPEQGVRLASAGGSRYDYWRVALVQFGDHPVVGAGAGNYDFAYFRERRTVEDIRQPHSLELQTLGELGLIGAALLLVFLVSVLLALYRGARAGPGGPGSGLVVAAGGTFVVWVAHSAVDWVHLIPGITLIVLAAAAALLAPWVGPLGESGSRLPRLVGLFLVCGAVALSAAGIGRLTVADRFTDQAQEALENDPRLALQKTADALSFNDDGVRTLYLRAAAFARLGDYPSARATLLRAVELEPERFVTWGLLGDLAVRRGELGRARGYYARASTLNPQDELLDRLATDRDLLRRLRANPDLAELTSPPPGGPAQAP